MNAFKKMNLAKTGNSECEWTGMDLRKKIKRDISSYKPAAFVNQYKYI